MSTQTPGPPRDAAGVLVIGSVTMDVTTFSSRLPRPGETFLGDAFTLVLGGKGANQAVAAGRAGAPIRFVGCVGDDLFAPLVRQALTEADVDVSHLREVSGQTGVAHIRVDASGENDIVMVPLANAEITSEQIDAAFAEFTPTSRVLLTQLEIPFARTMHAIRRGHDAGLTVVLDPAPAHDLDESIWPLVDVVTPNETEASLLTGIEVDSREAAVRAGQWFVDRGVGHALVTMAAAGSVLVDAGGVRDIPAHPVQVIDTTAAGDAFAGYLAASLAAGDELPAAIDRAAAAGAVAVTRRGASPSIPQADEVAAALAATAPGDSGRRRTEADTNEADTKEPR
ncbi:ribokinase [Brachybacterium sp. P6-10-X1]|uniref:ribokinase n=1 Tax=Brachybacterium sp. P6-10-X1 TaxID=1903186 RepID=UPI0009718CC6|nr:ribokinase [Brachybacterium sp. P6-10-X1]APX35001.1 ribokinase [Brachybacterium sp. P6-10-X1]